MKGQTSRCLCLGDLTFIGQLNRLSKKPQNGDFLKLSILSPTSGELTYWTAYKGEF